MVNVRAIVEEWEAKVFSLGTQTQVKVRIFVKAPYVKEWRHLTILTRLQR